MKKLSNQYYSNKEYSLYKHSKEKKVSFVLTMLRPSITFKLSCSYQEWKNIIKFLQMTISKKMFHKNAKGHIWFVINKNKFIDYRDCFLSKFLISANIALGNMHMQMHNAEFIKFRKFCIDANRYLFSPEADK